MTTILLRFFIFAVLVVSFAIHIHFLKTSKDKTEKTIATISLITVSGVIIWFTFTTLEFFGVTPVHADYWDKPNDDKTLITTPADPELPADKPKKDIEKTTETINEHKNQLDEFEKNN